MLIVDEPGVLMPAELHSVLGGLDDVLLIEQVDRVAEDRLRDFDHELGAQELFDRGALAVGVDEVAAATMVEVELVDAEAIHLAVALVNEALALAAQPLEFARGEDAVEDEEALVAEAASVLGRDVRDCDSHG